MVRFFYLAIGCIGDYGTKLFKTKSLAKKSAVEYMVEHTSAGLCEFVVDGDSYVCNCKSCNETVTIKKLWLREN